MSDLDSLARAATRELLDTAIPDVPARYAELQRIRGRRTAVKLVGAGAAVLMGILGLQLIGLGEKSDPQPVAPSHTVHNGALLGVHDVGSDGGQAWATAYGDMDDHLPTDADSQPLMQFSPDGRTLYYSDDHRRLAAWDLATGSKQVLMPCPERGCVGGSISPDGSTGLFLGSEHLVVADLATGKTRTMPMPVPDAGPMAWSPDGHTLAYTNSAGLWTMRSDGTDATQIYIGTPATATPFSVSWSPDGSRIAFFDTRNSKDYRLVTVGPDGGDPVRVHGAGAWNVPGDGPPTVVWSPDGTQLAVATADLGVDTGVYTLRPDGSQWTLRMKGSWSFLSWQPKAD